MMASLSVGCAEFATSRITTNHSPRQLLAAINHSTKTNENVMSATVQAVVAPSQQKTGMRKSATANRRIWMQRWSVIVAAANRVLDVIAYGVIFAFVAFAIVAAFFGPPG
jgi:hypothetical protein